MQAFLDQANAHAIWVSKPTAAAVWTLFRVECRAGKAVEESLYRVVCFSGLKQLRGDSINASDVLTLPLTIFEVRPYVGALVSRRIPG